MGARLTILQPLGVGGMASVHLAEMTLAGTTRKVAVKQLHPFIAADEASVALLEWEARLAKCIQHPNVVGVIDLLPASSESSAPTLVMEWIDGANLGSMIAATSKSHLPPDVIVAIMCDLLRGLHAAHEAHDGDAPLEIVHRDVSPQNVIVGTDGIARLTDFGVARALWRLEATKIGVIKGKLGYMAPEQLEGRVDRRADIYAAGVVLWELLTAKRFRSLEGEASQVLIQILHGFATAPSAEGAIASLDEIVLRALARFPEDRFATALEMADALSARIAPASPARVAAVMGTLRPAHDDEAITIDLSLDGPTLSRAVATLSDEVTLRDIVAETLANRSATACRPPSRPLRRDREHSSLRPRKLRVPTRSAGRQSSTSLPPTMLGHQDHDHYRGELK